jgi:hypothetical protein
MAIGVAAATVFWRREVGAVHYYETDKIKENTFARQA